MSLITTRNLSSRVISARNVAEKAHAVPSARSSVPFALNQRIHHQRHQRWDLQPQPVISKHQGKLHSPARGSDVPGSSTTASSNG
jgi:hypothetical protein